MRTAKEWNALSVSVFPDEYNLLYVFKARVDTLFLARHAPSSIASSFNIKWGGGQMPVY